MDFPKVHSSFNVPNGSAKLKIFPDRKTVAGERGSIGRLRFTEYYNPDNTTKQITGFDIR